VINIQNEELVSVALLINDDLQKTFSRYADLKKNKMPEVYISALLNNYSEGHTSNNPPSSSNPRFQASPVNFIPSDDYSESPPRISPSTPRPPYARPAAIENYKPSPSNVKQSDPNDIFGLFDAPEETNVVPSMPLDSTPVLQPTTAPIRPTLPNNFTSSPLNPRYRLMYTH
jgi:hypothetical protein